MFNVPVVSIYFSLSSFASIFSLIKTRIFFFLWIFWILVISFWRFLGKLITYSCSNVGNVYLLGQMLKRIQNSLFETFENISFTFEKSKIFFCKSRKENTNKINHRDDWLESQSLLNCNEIFMFAIHCDWKQVVKYVVRMRSGHQDMNKWVTNERKNPCKNPQRKKGERSHVRVVVTD